MNALKRALLTFLIILCPPAISADYYTASGDPVTGSALNSSVLRAEYAAIATGFSKIAPYTSANNRLLFINSGATAQTTDAELTYNGTTNVLTVNGSTFGTNTSIGGTLGVTGVATLTAQPILSSLTASLPVFSDASKGLVSNAMTGTGNVMMSASPTTTGTLTAAIANFSGPATFNAGATVASGQTLTLTGATVAGAPTWSSSQAITLSTAAQPNVTSVGTLTASSAAAGTFNRTTSVGDVLAVQYNGNTGGAIGIDSNGDFALFAHSGGVFSNTLVLGVSSSTPVITIASTGAVSLGSNSLTAGAISGTTGVFTTSVVANTKTFSTTLVSGVGLPTVFTPGAGKVITFTLANASGLFVIEEAATGSTALVGTSYDSATVTIIWQSGALFEASSTPAATHVGIYKSATSGTVSVKTGASYSAAISINLLGTKANSTTDPA